jgi:hypothetical protein
MDGVDDLRAVDPLEVDAGHPQIAMPELALDNDQWDALVCELDSVGMPELMFAPTSAQASLGRLAGYADGDEKVFARWDVGGE